MRYTDSHEWFLLTDGTRLGKVGITHYAREELGEIVHVELPEVGSKVRAGEEVSVLESTKAAADVYAPVSGTVTEVNTTLDQNLVSLNQNPESSGWLFQLELSDPKEMDNLLCFEEYRLLTEQPAPLE